MAVSRRRVDSAAENPCAALPGHELRLQDRTGSSQAGASQFQDRISLARAIGSNPARGCAEDTAQISGMAPYRGRISNFLLRADDRGPHAFQGHIRTGFSIVNNGHSLLRPDKRRAMARREAFEAACHCAGLRRYRTRRQGGIAGNLVRGAPDRRVPFPDQ